MILVPVYRLSVERDVVAIPPLERYFLCLLNPPLLPLLPFSPIGPTLPENPLSPLSPFVEKMLFCGDVGLSSQTGTVT